MRPVRRHEFQHRDAVHLGQADVEDDGIVRFGLAQIVPLLAVEGAIDDIAGVGQRGGELAIEIGVVLDDEQAQGIFLRRTANVR